MTEMLLPSVMVSALAMAGPSQSQLALPLRDMEEVSSSFSHPLPKPHHANPVTVSVTISLLLTPHRL